MLQRVKTHFSVENFSSHKTEIFVEERGTLLCCVSKLSGSEKFMDKKGGVSQFSVSVFVSQYGTTRRGTRNPSVLCFRKFLLSKNFMDKKRAGASQFSVETFLSHSTETFRRGNILCCVLEKIWWRKSVRIRRGA